MIKKGLIKIGALALGIVPSVFAQSESTVRLELVVSSGLDAPVFVTSAPGNTKDLFILEQEQAKILVYDLETNTLAGDSFFDVSGVLAGGERGLLGLAFHPDYENNGRFFTYSTGSGGATRVIEHRIGESDRLILTYPQPFVNHNGGWIGFGPDGYLYISSGDGGGGNDPRNAGQSIVDDPSTNDANEAFLGKILRIDVDGPDAYPGNNAQNYAIPQDNPYVGQTGADEIWLYGLRNPWRCSFDRETGDFWIADVGQNTREEVNFFPANPAPDENRNFGWRFREGLIQTPGSIGGQPVGGARPTDNVDPIWDNAHLPGRRLSITGGYVYRGESMPWLRGTYFVADFNTSDIWSFKHDRSGAEQIQELRRQSTPGSRIEAEGFGVSGISSFGEGPDGELYMCCFSSRDSMGIRIPSRIYRITSSLPLWNNNFFTDSELADPDIGGAEADPDGDGKPNLAEFTAGQNPRVGDAALPANVTFGDEGGEQFAFFSFQASPQADQVSVMVEQNSGLEQAGWIDSQVVESDPETGEYIFRSNRSISDDDRVFMRLRFEVPAN